MVSNCSVGITVDFQSASNNQAVIENNTVTNNAVGVQIGGESSPTMSDNNIYGNTLNAKLTGPTSINLPNNWWGTTDTQAINQTIYDFKDDFTLGIVTFVPFLTAPNSEATPNLNVPIPTPAPTSTQPPSPSPTTTSKSTPTSSASPSASSSASQSQQPITSLTVELIVAVMVIVIVAVAIGAFLLGKRAGRK